MSGKPAKRDTRTSLLDPLNRANNHNVVVPTAFSANSPLFRSTHYQLLRSGLRLLAVACRSKGERYWGAIRSTSLIAHPDLEEEATLQSIPNAAPALGHLQSFANDRCRAP